jgi:N6-adenosine-specific RNA methylase IME4
MATVALNELWSHKDAVLVPDMRPHEYAELLADIREHGVKVPLDVLDGVVLDGRHRLRAAKELGLAKVPVRELRLNGESATDWLLKAAVLRRHLSDDQRAMMAARYAKQRPEKRGPKPSSPRAEKIPHATGVSNSTAKAARQPALADAASRANVTLTKAEKAASVLKAAPELAEQVHRGELKLAQAVRQVLHAQRREKVRELPKPDGLYEVLVYDPPWQYDRQPTDSGMRGECDYATMSIAELKALALPAAPNCVLWLWTTNSFMREAYELLDAWGFTPKTILTWDKVNLGLGEWLRNVTEHCILAVRGRPVVTLTNQTTLIREPRRQHSRKPEAFYTLVESLCPGRKYEHFSRTPRKGWFGYGVEADKFAASV